MKWCVLTIALLQAPPSGLKIHTDRTYCIAAESPHDPILINQANVIPVTSQCYQTVWSEIPWIDPKDIKPEYEEEVINGKVWGWGILAR